jgi:hypothetical protein
MAAETLTLAAERAKLRRNGKRQTALKQQKLSGGGPPQFQGCLMCHPDCVRSGRGHPGRACLGDNSPLRGFKCHAPIDFKPRVKGPTFFARSANGRHCKPLSGPELGSAVLPRVLVGVAGC